MAQVITGLKITKIEVNGKPFECQVADVTFKTVLSDEDKAAFAAIKVPKNLSFSVEVKAKTVQEKINLLDLCHAVDGSQARAN